MLLLIWAGNAVWTKLLIPPHHPAQALFCSVIALRKLVVLEINSNIDNLMLLVQKSAFGDYYGDCYITLYHESIYSAGYLFQFTISNSGTYSFRKGRFVSPCIWTVSLKTQIFTAVQPACGNPVVFPVECRPVSTHFQTPCSLRRLNFWDPAAGGQGMDTANLCTDVWDMTTFM